MKQHGAIEQPDKGDHEQMLLDMRRKWLWTNFTVISLGLWLALMNKMRASHPSRL